ncbi:MAG: DDE-type integrase/transposase/recombinase [Patescibacteria group bacterium]
MPGSQTSAPKEMRFRWYRQVEREGRTVKDACEIFGIGRKTCHKWHRRDHGWEPGVRHPKRTHPQTKIVGVVLVEMLKAKRLYNYGPKKMGAHLKQALDVSVSPNAIYKKYLKRDLVRKPQKKQAWYHPMKEPYIATKPGENVQLDVKYVPGRDGTWLYKYRLVDTVTNVQYAVNMPSRNGRTTIAALKLAERHMPFQITGIQTDDGGEFRGAFARHLAARDIPQRFIPKRSAPWNGKVERANCSVDDEYYLNPHRPWKSLSAYTRWYNSERPHLGRGMGGLTPYAKLAQFSQ